MALIFGFSTEAGAPRHTSRILGPLLRWINPGLSDETIQRVQLVVRKSAHLTEYAVLALLVWRARRRPVRGDRRPWRRSDMFFALAVAALFAATDEWHQSFVPSREGRFTDVLIDSTGAAVGLLAGWSWGRWRKHW
jgi:VanZ family protein